MSKILTSESVTEGHPDKVCDQISDAVLDAILEQDPKGRVACETMVAKDKVFITGEITSTANINIEDIVRKTLEEIGYEDSENSIDFKTCDIEILINEQSSDIAQGVNESYETREENIVDDNFEIGAGDQGMMFGYASNETEELMPLPIHLAHKLSKRLRDSRKNKELTYLKPDGKTQVSVEYDENNKPLRVDTVVVSTQHDSNTDIETVRKDIKEKIIEPVLGEKWIDEDTKIFINPTGRFVIGGPKGDAGLTGRKIIVDTYGGIGRHGGGAFSGKDPTKVDRSASYAARWVAKNIVGAGLADRAEVQLAYAIGVAEPVSINVNTFGTGIVSDNQIEEAVEEVFDLRPAAIIEELDLQKPQYKQTAAYGHFGRHDLDVNWEKLNRVEELKEKLK